MNHFKVSLFALLALAVSSTGFAAEEPKFEIWLTNLASLNFGWYNNGLITSNNVSVSAFSQAGITGGYILGSGLEVILSPSLYYASALGNGNPNATWSILAGLNYSFMPADFENSFFVQAQAGIASSTIGGNTSNAFAWEAGLGKRFKVLPHLTYAPSVNVAMNNFTQTWTYLQIVPLQFSYIF